MVYNNDMRETKYFIDAVLEKERHRNETMLSTYRKRLLDLPRGTLIIRELNGRKYCYLRYREGKSVIQKYAGTIDKEESLRQKIDERKHLIELISMLEEENKIISKMEAVK